MIDIIIYSMYLLANKMNTKYTSIIYTTLSYSFYGIKNIYIYLSEKENNNIKDFIISIMNDEFISKLEMVKIWLKSYNVNTSNSNKKIVYEMINNNCKIITDTIDIIDKKIVEHKKIWFYTWRCIDIDNDLCILKETITNLNNNIKYIYVE